VKRLLVAIRFLTIVPVGRGGELAPCDLGRSMLFFPAVGALLGLALAGAYVELNRYLPALAASAIVVIVSTALTGGLHLDGLADTFDGFYAGRSREKTLEIMKDSRIGVMGAAALFSVLLLKTSLLAGLPTGAAPAVLVAMPAVGRWSLVLGAHRSPCARADGLGRVFIEGVGRLELLAATVVTACLGVALLQWAGAAACVSAALATYGTVKYAARRIGGVTGDILGAINEASETIVLLVAAISHSSGI